MNWNDGVCKYCGEGESSSSDIPAGVSFQGGRRITYFCGTEVRVLKKDEIYYRGAICQLNTLKKKHKKLERRVRAMERLLVSKNMNF